jgi:hypothetical protein
LARVACIRKQIFGLIYTINLSLVLLLKDTPGFENLTGCAGLPDIIMAACQGIRLVIQ